MKSPATTFSTLLSTVVAALTASTLLQAPAAQAVVFGTAVDPSPHVVRIISPRPCTATFIAPTWIISAAHCDPQRGSRPDLYQVQVPYVAPQPSMFGSLDSFFARPQLKEPAIVGARRVVVAPGADVMLIEIDQLTDGQPIPMAQWNPKVGDVLQFYGYGHTDFKRTYATQLHTAATKVTGLEYRSRSTVIHNHGLDGGYALGDSGGPAILNGQLIGVHQGSDHSRHQPNGSNPGRLESVPALRGWIRSVTGV